MKKLLVRVGLGVVCLVLGWGALRASADLMLGVQNIHVGKNAPDFTLATTSGKQVNMTKFRDGKNAVVFFWATWCPHCRVQLKEMNAMADKLEAEGIRVIPVDLGEDLATVKSYLKKNKIKYEVFLDEESGLGEMYGIIGVPTLFFIDGAGIVRATEHEWPKNYRDFFQSDTK